MGSRIRRAKTAARQIRAIVIQARGTGMVVEIEDSVQAFRRVTGVNSLATALWYCLNPKAAAQRWRDGGRVAWPGDYHGWLDASRRE